jgi:CHAT domain-containing protein
MTRLRERRIKLRSGLTACFGLVGIGAIAVLSSGSIAKPDPLAEAKQARDAYVRTFREIGRIDPAVLAASVPALEALAAASDGATRARALYELGTIQRMTNHFSHAAATLAEAADLAAASGARDVAFNAWIGVARAHAYGTADHAAAAAAYEHAVDLAGDAPTQQQRYELITYRAQLELGRGETEAGLIDALEAQRIAAKDEDRFYSELDVGDALQKFAESCDYRPLIDERSFEPGGTPYDACRRAVASAQAAYAHAAGTADSLGWQALAAQARQFQSNLNLRRQLIDMRAKDAAAIPASAFSPRLERDVLVNRDFSAGASGLTDQPLLAALAEQVVSEADARTGKTDARSNYLRGLIADIRSGNQVAGTAFFVEAARQLSAERGAFFDARRRGTVIENRGEILQTLALRLLALGQDADAFATFESVRARGLGEVAGVLSQPDVTTADRRWFATLVELEAQASKLETHIVRHVIASGAAGVTPSFMEKLAKLRMHRQQVLRANEAARTRFAAAQSALVRLDELQAAATHVNVPVIFYWCTYTNVIVWVIGPHGSDVRTVFLPQHVLAEKIRRVVRSADNGGQAFDEATARELYLYLVAPFTGVIDSSHIIIVPQGPLTALPFEALIDPGSGKPLIEKWAVSYSPNATFAARALGRSARKLDRVAALVDPEIEDATHERRGIAAMVPVRDVSRSDLTTHLNVDDGLHVLFHGIFDSEEPLLSELIDPNAQDDPLRATDLLAVPLAGRPLVVLSACESGRTDVRTSNEIYGFPWALLAGGAEAAVVSRWRVDGGSNSDWMRDFYGAMAAGALPSDAAKAAMRHMRARDPAHPYFWGAMQVIGR